MAVAALAVVTGKWLVGPAAVARAGAVPASARSCCSTWRPPTVLIGLGAVALAVVVHLPADAAAAGRPARTAAEPRQADPTQEVTP